MTKKYHLKKIIVLTLFILLTSCGQQTNNNKMGLFDRIFSKQKTNINWEEVKKTDKVYPPNSISLLMLKTDGGKSGTGWVDKAYNIYAYKEFCPYNFLIMVDLTDNIAESNPNLDMATIEDFFVNELRTICIAHIVARVVTDVGINIEMYLELQEPAIKHLQTILDNPKRFVSFSCEVNEDPKWTAVSGLMNFG